MDSGCEPVIIVPKKLILKDTSLESKAATFFKDWNIYNYITGKCKWTDVSTSDGVEDADEELKPSSKTSKFYLSALGSVTNDEMLEAARFPEMIGYDTTCKTNTYSYKLAYVIGCNSEWQNINFLTTVLKREQKLHFSFVFNLCLPLIYGEKTLAACSLVLSDGDPHLIDVIDNTISAGCLVNAKRRRCYYHLANKKFDDMYGKFRNKDGGVGDKVSASVKDIVFYTECEDEFQQQWDSLTSWLTEMNCDASFDEYVNSH